MKPLSTLELLPSPLLLQLSYGYGTKLSLHKDFKTKIKKSRKLDAPSGGFVQPGEATGVKKTLMSLSDPVITPDPGSFPSPDRFWFNLHCSNDRDTLSSVFFHFNYALKQKALLTSQ